MSSIINRIGEESINNFGSKMIIIKYRGVHDIDVYFPKYDWVLEQSDYTDFKNGELKCPYEPRTFGEGYLGDGKYKTYDNNGKITREYSDWLHILERCYSNKLHKRKPTYIDKKVCEEWLNFQNFAKWYEENYYEIDGYRMCLDKDLINKNNTTYSPDNCCYIPNEINTLIVKNDKIRGEYPIGVHKRRNGLYVSQCRTGVKPNRKNIYLGCFNTPIEAFYEYKRFKEYYIKCVAEKFKDSIPKNVYDALNRYEVCITD